MPSMRRVRARVASVKQVLDDVLPFMLLLVALLALFQFIVPVTDRMQQGLYLLNYVVVGYFTLRLAADYVLHDGDGSFLRQHWLDLVAIVPTFVMLREARLAQLARESAAFPTLDELVATTAARNTRVAASITRMVRLVKRSLRM